MEWYQAYHDLTVLGNLEGSNHHKWDFKSVAIIYIYLKKYSQGYVFLVRKKASYKQGQFTAETFWTSLSFQLSFTLKTIPIVISFLQVFLSMF